MTNDNVHILLVEDNKIDVMAFKRAFSHAKVDFPIRVAQNGIEALHILRGENGHEPLSAPFIVMLDINMPLMNGFEFLDEIRSDAALKRCIVFVLTTSEDPADVDAAHDRQVAGFLSKHSDGKLYAHVIDVIQPYCEAVRFPALSA